MGTAPVFRNADWDNLEFVRQIILYRLKHDPDWHQFDNIWDERSVSNFVEFNEPRLRGRFVELSHEVMWQLIVQGVITPGLNSSNLNLPFFRITEYGNKVLEEGRSIPHDATGYLKNLRKITGVFATDVAIAYIEEALNCFNHGCHIASVLLLGIAAESIFNNMCKIVNTSLNNPKEQRKLDPKLPVKPRHSWIVKKYESLPKTVRREDLPESLYTTLGSLYELIRSQRNELGHLQDKLPELSRERAFLYFTLLPSFVEDAQAFAKYCQDKGI